MNPEVTTLLNLMDSQLRLLAQWRDRGEAFLRAMDQKDTDAAMQLDSFLSDRDRLLEILGLFDRKITEVAHQLPPGVKSQQLSQAIQERLENAQVLLAATAEQDDRIRNLLSERVAALMRDAAIAGRSRQLLAKFKSQQNSPSGEELDSHR